MNLPTNAKEIFENSGYYVTPDGRVFSSRFRKGHGIREMSYMISNSGYYYCNLSINRKIKLYYVHRLVAIAFIPNPDNKEQVNHIDGNKLNNNIENLEWVTQSENCSHYRNLPVKKVSKTSGREGKLYHMTKYIGHFRSLQQAKEYCKMNFNCSLSTEGERNINIKNKLFFIRDTSEQNIDDVWNEYLIHQSFVSSQIIENIKSTKGISGVVYDGDNFLGSFASIREAQDFLHCCFKKRGNVYRCRTYTFTPHTK